MFTTLPLGCTRFSGWLEEEIDRVLSARIRSEHAAHTILPEAVEAFRLRVDDRIAPGRGLWQGEFWGKWTLSAVAAQRYTGDDDLKQVILDGVREVVDTQRSDGYIGTYHDSGFVVGNTWNVWCRKYALWGLLDAYELLGEDFILEAAARMTDHLMTEVGPDAVRIVETGNFVGLPSSSILTPVVKLYRLTGERRYLEYAHWIVDDWGRSPGHPPDIVRMGLTGRPVHTWFPEAGRWTKAYEFISCVEGLLDLGRVDDVRDYLTAARNIHEAIRKWDRAVTGGIGDNDKLMGAARHAVDALNEPCDVVYWERLSARLLEATGHAKFADEVERLTVNVLAGVMNRDGSWGLRRMGLSEPHLIAPLHCLLHHHQCCVANLPRGLLQLAEVAVMRRTDESGLVLNLYFPLESTVELGGGVRVRVRVESQYPWDGSVRIRVITSSPAEFTLALRIPAWSKHTAVQVNGVRFEESSVRSGEYLEVARRWDRGDAVNVVFDLNPRFEPLPEDTSFAAVCMGPVVLARSSRLEGERSGLHSRVALDAASGRAPRLEPAPPSTGVRAEFRLTTDDGRCVPLCDYSSTGRDFQKPGDPHAFQEMVNNRVPWDVRVYLPTT